MERVQKVLRDAVIRIGLLVVLAYLLLYALPLLSPSQMDAFSEHWSEPVLLAVLIVGLLKGLRSTDHPEERRFWGLLAACFGLWLVGTTLNSVG